MSWKPSSGRPIPLAERARLEVEIRRRRRSVEAAVGSSWAPAGLMDALERCINAEALIPGEQAKFDSLIANATDPKRKAFYEYQRDLVRWQLERAAASARRRKAHFEALETEEDWERERELCAMPNPEDPADESCGTVYFFRWHAWTMDPRPDAPLAVQPFDPFEFQVRSLRWTDRLVFDLRTDGVVEKSRDMGATWEKVGWAVKHWLFVEHFSVLFGSITEDKIDRVGELDTIFEKIRFFLRMLHPKMLPAGFSHTRHSTFMHVLNPANGALLVGEAPTPNFGRSGRYSAILFDELAFWSARGNPQWTAASQSSRSKICFSSVNGKRTKQYELRQMKDMPVLSLPWRLHPWKDRRWYDGQSFSMKAHEIAQELDMDYTASQTGRLLAAFDERRHVITWNEFAEMFGGAAVDDKGRIHLPYSGYIGMGQDVGTTEGHPNASGWVWRPKETMPYSDCVFVYRERLYPEYPEPSGRVWSIGQIAKEIFEAERPWAERLRASQLRLISHEGESERRTYVHDVQDGTDPDKPDDYRLYFRSWEVDKRAGLTQLQNYLEVDYTREHQVRRYPKGAVNLDGESIEGQLLMGRVRLFVVVANGQGELYWRDGKENVVDAVDCHGMARTRAEIPEYRLPTDTAGEEKREVKPLFNDCVDWLKALAHSFFPDIEPLTPVERVAQHLDKYYPLPKVDAETGQMVQEAGLVSPEEVAQTRAIEAKRMLAQIQQQYAPARRPRGGIQD